MKLIKTAAMIATLAALAACGDTARSTEYFADHLDEAEKVVTDCRAGTITGAECSNANDALRVARGAKRHSENFGDPNELPKFGNGY